jgi:hypothetical protein
MATQQAEVNRLYGITFSHLTRAEPVAAFVSAQEVFALFPSLKGKFKLTKDGTIVRTFWSGKGGTAVKVGAIVVGGLVLRGLLGYFSVKVYARYAQNSLDEQFDEIRPQIEKDLRSQREVALTFVAAGEQAFAVTVIKIWTNSDFVTEQGTSMPRVEYLGLTISPKKKESHTSETKHYVGNSSDIDIYTTSTPVTFDNDFVEIYKDYQKALTWYLQRLTATTNDAERNNLQEEYRAVIDEMNRILKQ